MRYTLCNFGGLHWDHDTLVLRAGPMIVCEGLIASFLLVRLFYARTDEPTRPSIFRPRSF